MPLARNGREQSIPDKPMNSPFGEGPWMVWVAVDGLQARSEVDLKSPPIVSNRFDFLQQVFVLARHSEPNIGPVLLVAKGNLSEGTVIEVMGWVREDFVMTSNGALRLPDTRICKKAMSVTRAENSDVSKAVPFRKGPVLNAKISQEKVTFFNVYYVFAETKNADYGIAKSNGNDASVDYVLLSTSQTIPTGKTADKVILGWLPKSKVVEWNTAEAIEWDSESRKSRKAPGKVFESVKQARDALDKPNANIPCLFEELDETLKPQDMRYPKIGLDPGVGPTIPPTYQGNELFRIGAIGGIGKKSFREVEAIKEQQRELNAQMTTTQLLFVIDDTSSMKKCFNQVATTVRSIVEQGVGKREVAIAFYNDRDNRSSNRKPVSVMKFKSEWSPKEIENQIANHETVSGGDFPEMVSYGVRAAITEAGFTRYSRKVLVLIGDSGCKDFPAPDNFAANLVPLFFPEKQSEIELLAIQVGLPDSDEFAEQFTLQTRALVNAINTRAKSQPSTRTMKTPLARYLEIDSTKLSSILEDRYLELQNKVIKDKDELDDAVIGTNSKIGDEYLNIIERENPGFLELIKSKEVQSFREGYVWRDSADGIQQVRIAAMIEEAELLALNLGIKEVLGITKKAFGKSKTVEEGMLELTNVIAKEKSAFDPKVSVEEQLFKKIGLTAKTPLLRKAMSEDGRSTRLKLQEINDITHRCELIDDILNGRERKWDEVDRDGLIYYESRGEAASKPRVWSSEQLDKQGSSIPHYWIDAEKELP